MSEQPKEYIITEYELDEIFAFLQNPPMFDIPEFTLEIEHQIRSRPAPASAPAAQQYLVDKSDMDELVKELHYHRYNNAAVVEKRIRSRPAPSALDELGAWLKEDSDSTYRITGQRLLSHECVLDKIAALRAREHKGGERDE